MHEELVDRGTYRCASRAQASESKAKTRSRTAPYLTIAAALLIAHPATSSAQTGAFPDKPIRVIVPFPPGGSPDVVVRAMGNALSERWHQSVVVDNRPGAGGTIGAALAAAASPDGYTMVMANTPTHAIDVSLYKHIDYDPVKDFEPIVTIGTTSPVLLVNAGLPISSVQELLQYAKRNPGKVLYGSAGNGTFGHLAMALFTSMAGISLVHVPYKGNPPALVDLDAGRIQTMFPTLPAALPHIKSGRARPLALGALARSPLLPNVPTVSEAGVRGYDARLWYAFFVPAHTPRAIVAKLNRDVNDALRDPKVVGVLNANGVDPVGGTPEELAKLVKSEIVKWREVIKESGARLD